MVKLKGGGAGILMALAGLVFSVPLAAQQSVEYEKGTNGTRLLESQNGAFSIKMLVEASNLGGGEVEIGEITFPPSGDRPIGRGHTHVAVEIFYILSGELDHIVNGESHLLTPGMVGIVRTGDRVVHRVPGSEPVKALVIWAPGGVADGVARNLVVRPISGGGK